MKREEAEKLIGKRVRVWTASNGIYVGTLQSICGSPWRGLVDVSGVIEPADHYQVGAPFCRKGYRPGDVIEAGNSSISPTDEEGFPDYLTACENAVMKLRETIERAGDSRHVWASVGMEKALRVAIALEKQRLETGEWDPSNARAILLAIEDPAERPAQHAVRPKH